MPTTHAKLSDNHSIYSSLCCLIALATVAHSLEYAASRSLAATSLDDVQISLPNPVLIQCSRLIQWSSMLSYITRRPGCAKAGRAHTCQNVWRCVMLTGDVDAPSWLTADLIKYMEKSTSTSSGAHSSTSTSLGGIVGSSVAPATIGVQYMPQPAAVQPQGQPLPQGVITTNTTANCTTDCIHSLPSGLIAIG